MAHRVIAENRGITFIQTAERLLLKQRAYALGRDLGNIAAIGTLKHPLFNAVIDGKCFSAQLRGVLTGHETYLSGSVLMEYRGPHRPQLEVSAQLQSDIATSGVYRFDSDNPDSLAAREHFAVIRELRRLATEDTARISVQHQ